MPVPALHEHWIARQLPRMARVRNFIFMFATAVLVAAPARAADPVEVAPLTTIDLFSIGYGGPGLGQDVWRGLSTPMARSVLPRLNLRNLSPAARELAIRLLTTGGTAPAGSDADLAAARAKALLALGQPEAVAVILNRAPNLGQNAELSRAASEAFLITAQDTQACEVEQGLGNGRDTPYWLRLRAYCQIIGGQIDAASLTFDLANQAERDPVYARLMGVLLAGAGSPGAPSYRNGLEIALGRKLGLASPPQAALPDIASPQAMSGWQPLLTWDDAPDNAAFDRLFDDAVNAATPASRVQAQSQVLILAAVGHPMSEVQREATSRFEAGRSTASAGALLALNDAAFAGLTGQTALSALAICVAAPPAGISPSDRISIIAALRRAGLAQDARAFALEGLAARPPP